MSLYSDHASAPPASTAALDDFSGVIDLHSSIAADFRICKSTYMNSVCEQDRCGYLLLYIIEQTVNIWQVAPPRTR